MSISKRLTSPAAITASQIGCALVACFSAGLAIVQIRAGNVPNALTSGINVGTMAALILMLQETRRRLASLPQARARALAVVRAIAALTTKEQWGSIRDLDSYWRITAAIDPAAAIAEREHWEASTPEELRAIRAAAYHVDLDRYNLAHTYLAKTSPPIGAVKPRA